MKHPSFDTAGLSARNRRILALGVHGGEGDDDLDLDALLARVDGMADLNDDDLATLDGDLVAVAQLLLEQARDTNDDEALAGAIRATDARDAVCGEAAQRITHAEELATRADEVAARLSGATDEPGDGEGEGDAAGDGDGAPGSGEGDAGAEGEGDGAAGAAGDGTGDAGGELSAEQQAAAAALAASAAGGDDTPARISRVAARRPRSTAPRSRERHDARMVLRASANVPGQQGQLLDTPESIFRAFDTVLRASQGYAGPRQQLPVCSLGVFDASEIYGEERTLRRDARTNAARIDSVTSRSALRASGGICAPPPIQYDLPTIGTDARPVRDALARFGADRGGVRLLPPPQLSDVEGAVGIWTEANDIALNSPSVKPCLELDCPEEVETLVDAITRCLKVGNFRARYFPEQVAAWTVKVGQWYARTAEVKMLTKIGAESTQITAGERILGTTRDVLRVMDRAAAATRSRHRLDPNFPLRMIGPAWLLNNMVSDLSAEQPGSTAERLATAASTIESWFAARNINVTWSLDGESGQIFGAQNDGALLAWPSQVVVYLFVEGEWLFLDGGTLDFGLVRDSTLNATNDFQLFSEGFEQVAFHGAGDTMRVKIDICANGATAEPVSTSFLCSDFS